MRGDLNHHQVKMHSKTSVLLHFITMSKIRSLQWLRSIWKTLVYRITRWICMEQYLNKLSVFQLWRLVTRAKVLQDSLVSRIIHQTFSPCSINCKVGESLISSKVMRIIVWLGAICRVREILEAIPKLWVMWLTLSSRSFKLRNLWRNLRSIIPIPC